MPRYARLFAALAVRKEGALIPFFMLGDPDPRANLENIEAAIAAGADALELGLPFSDPVADGPTIVAAANRALAAGVTPAHCFAMIAQIRARHPQLPIGLLVYVNLVFARGLDRFYADAVGAGVDSVLIADLPLREAGPFRRAAQRQRIAPVFILPPDADEATVVTIAQASEGYTYVLGRGGVTGAEKAAEMPAVQRLEALKRAGAAPPVIGFGISRPSHVHDAIAAGAAGVIVGSALIGALAGNKNGAALIAELKAATRLSKGSR